MGNMLPFKTPLLPSYVVDLLMAARNVLYLNCVELEVRISELEKAVIQFEKNMPVDEKGFIRERTESEFGASN